MRARSKQTKQIIIQEQAVSRKKN